MRPLGRKFYNRNVVDVARDLVGKILIRQDDAGRLIGRIVETEAYLAENDSACHASHGKTRKNATMFGPAGMAYVYAIHSRWCVNVVADKEMIASAALIRAVEPLFGLEIMQGRRSTDDVLALARGPGRLCQALDIDRTLDGWDLTIGEKLWICHPTMSQQIEFSIGTSVRIGVTSAKDLPLRFFVKGSRFVSGPRRHHKD